ncbi:MAG: cytochrome c biogenesis protein [Pirellulaceae bacterium]
MVISRHRYVSVSIAVLLLGVMPSSARAAADATFDWKPWHSLATQDNGRVKPLDSLAWETLRLVANRGSLTDPDTGQKSDAVQSYLVLLFEWQGWRLPQSVGGATGGQGANHYFGPHQSDKWDRMPLIRVDDPELRTALGIKTGENSISPFDLNQAKIEVPGTHEERPFVLWVEGLRRREETELSGYEKTALELADRYSSYQHHRMGDRLFVLPIKGSENQQWMSVAELASAKFDEQSDPTGQLREAQTLFLNLRTAYLSGSSDEFNRVSAAWLQKMNELGPQCGDYASPTKIRLEVLYNQWVAFRCAWVCTLLACVCLLLNMGSGWKPFLVGGWSLFLCGLTAMTGGFVMRVLISGRAPVTNMYESVVYVGLGVALLGILFEAVYRKTYLLTAASAVATVALILADNCPAVLDPSLRPLQPVLRNNFWLVTHVMTITLSYAAFALALGISNITLGYYVVGAGRHAAVDSLTSFTCRAMQVGVWLLAAGTVLGGVWADYSWGRFWGWDPKEVWALISLLAYLAVLHAKHGGWVHQFGLAALCAVCFSLVIMAWYGVNFVLGAGLHSYGFGGGGTPFVVSAVCLQAMWVAVAGVRYAWQRREEREVERLRYNPTTSRLVSCP